MDVAAVRALLTGLEALSLDDNTMDYVAESLAEEPQAAEEILAAFVAPDTLAATCGALQAALAGLSARQDTVPVAADSGLPVRLAASVTMSGRKVEPDPVAAPPAVGPAPPTATVAASTESKPETPLDGEAGVLVDSYAGLRADMAQGFFGTQQSRFHMDRAGRSKEILLKGLFLAFRQGDDLLDNATLMLMPGHRYGLVGKNGIGAHARTIE